MLPHHGGTKRPAPQDQQSANSNNQNNKRVALSENSSAAATPSPSSSRPARSPATSTTGAAAPSTLVQPKPKAGGGLLDSIRAGKFIRTSNGASSAAESGDSALASPSAAMARASAMTPSSSAATLAAAAKARTEYQVVFPSMGSIVPPSNRHTVLNRFIVELQRIYPNDKDAGYKEALALEQKVYSAANSKMGYTNGAAHALGSLKERRQGQAPIVHADKYAMEQNIEKYLLTREQLLENGFLLSSADHVQSETTAAAPRVCERCDTLLDMDDVHTSGVEPDPSSSGKVPLLSTCQHHPGRVWQRRRGKWVCGEMAFYSCCEAAPSAVGCKTAAFHVPRAPELTVPDCMDTGKDSTCTPSSAIRCFGVDCEMVSTTNGTELARATVVDCNKHIVLDELVQPQHPVLDYNTEFSGITAAKLAPVKTTLRDVQQRLLGLLDARTILLGHSLESDLHALKLIHARVVDTSVLFPHPKGFPFKRALRSLSADILGRAIQLGALQGGGHDSAEDASTCIDLLKWKIRHDIDYEGPRTTVTAGASESLLLENRGIPIQRLSRRLREETPPE